jgi:hypothetical protein
LRSRPTIWTNRLGAALLLAAACQAQLSEDLRRRFEKADRAIVRLPPSAFPELPANLAAELQRRSCSIPQAFPEKRHNVIRGQFAKPGQTDWAVLCSVNGVSAILVFWNASEKNPAEIARQADRDRLQGAGGDTIVYSRAISAVGKSFILEHYRAYGGPQPPPLDHQGIDDAFVEKASVVLYFHQGKWLELTGAD